LEFAVESGNFTDCIYTVFEETGFVEIASIFVG